jgi:O-succinylbenzoic acid--CoA ligase
MNKITKIIDDFLELNNLKYQFEKISFEIKENHDSNPYLVINSHPFSCDYFLSVLACLKFQMTAILSNPFWGDSEKKNLDKLVSNFDFPKDEFHLILFSSGSSGTPKGILHTLESLMEASESAINYFQMEKGDSFLVSLPQHHIGGLMIGLRALFCGGKLCFLEHQQKVEDELKSNSYDYISLVPAQLKNLIKGNHANLKKAKGILLGGAKEDHELQQLIQGYPVYLTFGMSETAAMMMARKGSEEGFDLMPGRIVKLDEQRKLNVGKYGLMKGYILDGVFRGVFSNDYLQTQDLFEIRDGKYFFCGRSDLMINSGGENIDPIEIENIIKSISGIKDAHVVGKAHEKWGEVAVAFIEPIDLEELVQKELEKKLLKYKIPKQYMAYPSKILIDSDKHVKLSRNELKQFAKLL